MQIQADTEVSLFVRDRVTDRLVFNPKAVAALGLSPTVWRNAVTRSIVVSPARRLGPRMTGETVC